MSKEFKGVINLGVTDSTPDWDPYAQPQAPKGAPNVLILVWDDTGFGSWDFFGGPIEMPNMSKLANNGLKYTQFHTTALCSPTRAALLSGRNHTTVGMSCVAEATQGFPGMNGHIPGEAALIGEILSDRGYNTYALGKWHCAGEDETNMASSKRNWPTYRGFERFYGFLGGEANQYYPNLVQDQQFVDQPADPVSIDEWKEGKDGYLLTADLVDRAIGMIGDAKQTAPDRPFFMYFCPGANHAPHSVPKAWADKYKGKFDMGYEAIREKILAKQIKMGIVPKGTELSPVNPFSDVRSADGKPFPSTSEVRPWDSLSDDEKKLQTRMAEVFAGFSSHADHEIGRLISYLEETGELDNTLIIVISDNGASGEGGPDGAVNENTFFNGVPSNVDENIKMIDILGSPGTYNHYSTGWAFAFNTPFKLFKQDVWEGGICDPMIVHWPAGIKAKGELRDQYTHVTDIVPTVYECLGIELPETVKGFKQWPLEGTSFKHTFEKAKAKTAKRSQFYQMLGTRALWRDGWKVDALHPSSPSDWGHFGLDKWALYHTDVDRAEIHNVADQHPDLAAELVALWYYQAGTFSGLPMEDRPIAELLSTPRPQVAPPRDHYVYYPNTLEVPEAVAVNIRGRSYILAADVVIDGPDAEGVLFAQGSNFGGHALYLKDGKLKYVYNYLGEKEQVIASNIDVPKGKVVLGIAFEKEKLITPPNSDQPSACIGNASLFIGKKKVGECKGMQTQLGNFALAGEGFNVGQDRGAPVTYDYSGARPWKLTGATIKQVIADVSGEAYVDVEREAAAMMARD
ncbi:arylsulfatase [Salinispora tropica]|uniref:Sulfatase n=1 Tax=Salinispora tropica (strain ATCC BAA-916 / DSM 44818 / JCM 13857 / NBRC 105044 / CNB-440) TaxID=369723 RepID=A4X918_SALTO|nr:arylsulfatase [Salinispora tropica]ABP55368.1 sulfatase [Salinispora tropica CNB-440]